MSSDKINVRNLSTASSNPSSTPSSLPGGDPGQTAGLSNEPPPDVEDDEEMEAVGPNPRPWPRADQYQRGQKVFALLIAVDQYDMPGANLGGCVKDSVAVETYLRNSTDKPDKRLHVCTLRSMLPSQVGKVAASGPEPASMLTGAPTRAGIIDAFQTFLTQAGEDDAVFIHYSGHGSFETRPQELWHLDAEESSTHRAESLVCQDSYTTVDGQFVPALRDKEVRWLISQVAQRNPHITLMMDCCNSAGNTRFKEEGTLARFTPGATVNERNSIKGYVFYQHDLEARATLDTNPTAFQIPEGRHVALYACHSYELAKETSFPEGRFGVFTYYLLQTLRATKGHITYRDLLKLVREKATQKVSAQSPQYYASLPTDTDLVFLGGSTGASDAFTLTPGDTAIRARMDAGSLHGLVGPEAGPTYLTVFPANLDSWAIEDAATMRAKIVELAPDHSIVELQDDASWPADTALLKAKVESAPLTKTKICLELEADEALISLDDIPAGVNADAITTAYHAVQTAMADHPHLELVDKASGQWDYRFFIYRYEGQDKLRITKQDKVEALIAPRVGWGKTTIQAVVDELTHIAKWQRTLSLQNPQPTLIQPGIMDLEVIDGNGEAIKDHGGEVVLEAVDGQAAPKLKFKAVLRDPLRTRLFCALVHLRPDFGINPSMLPPDAHLGVFSSVEGGSRIERKQLEVYAGSHIAVGGATDPLGLYLQFSVPEGKTESVDHFKLIVSTEEFDSLHLWQNKLELADTPRAGRKPDKNSTLDHLMHEVQNRDASWAGVSAEPPKKVTDWWSTTVTVKTKRV